MAVHAVLLFVLLTTINGDLILMDSGVKHAPRLLSKRSVKHGAPQTLLDFRLWHPRQSNSRSRTLCTPGRLVPDEQLLGQIPRWFTVLPSILLCSWVVRWSTKKYLGRGRQQLWLAMAGQQAHEEYDASHFQRQVLRAMPRQGRSSISKEPTFNYTRPSKTVRETVLDFLCRRFTYNDREQWMDAIAAGRISVNGAIVDAGFILSTRDQVSYQSSIAEVPVDPTFEIIYEDEAIIVVSKSGNLPVAASGRYFRNTLTYILRSHLETRHGREQPVYPVHRLDRETSGLVVFALTEQAARSLSQAFAEDCCRKEYHAVLTGRMSEAVRCSLPITECFRTAGSASTLKGRMCCDPSGKEAVTHFEPIHTAGGLTLCLVRPLTGRTHQIRVHASAIGHPILGDKLYGQTDEDFRALTKGTKACEFPPFGTVERHLLHASSITFPHPITGEPLHLTSSCVPAFRCSQDIANCLFAAA